MCGADWVPTARDVIGGLGEQAKEGTGDNHRPSQDSAVADLASWP